MKYCSFIRFPTPTTVTEDTVDTATVLTGEQQAVQEQSKPLEAVMLEEVRGLYMATMETHPDFRGELNLDWFKQHFATVAHQHNIFHHKNSFHLTAEQREDRKRYNLYFGLVRAGLSTWLGGHIRRQKSARMNSLKATSPSAAQNGTRHGPVLGPAQLPLFGNGPPVSPPESFRRWLADRNKKE